MSFVSLVKILLPKTVKKRIMSSVLNIKDKEAVRLNSWKFGVIKRVEISDIFQGIEHIEIKMLNCFLRSTGISVDPLELLYLNAIVKFIGAKKICEIGTYDGNTILNLAANTPEEAILVTIDLPIEWNGEFAISIGESKSNVTNRDRIGWQYKNTKYAEKIKQIFCDSAILNWDTLTGPFDLIFIDGCHDYRYVKTDTENAFNHLSSSGVIIWHDYGMIKDVSDAVDTFQDKLEIKVITGTRVAVGLRK